MTDLAHRESSRMHQTGYGVLVEEPHTTSEMPSHPTTNQ